MSYRLGQQVGNYRLVRQLGRGGFAEVYLGEHRYLKSYAALKVLQVSLTDEEVQRFLSEAQTLVRLRHPNIVHVLDYSVERRTGTPVLVMDYAPGGTIRQRHPRNSILSLAMTVAYVKQVAAALQYAHDRHIIHRDVKPENILLGPDSTLLLSDFGLALFSPTPELLNSQDPAGTRPYMAPEQFQGKPTFASDQYALAVVTYEWLCGKRPFEGNQWEIVHQHFFAEPPPLREQYPELPAEIEQVVLKALAKEPQDRFASVQAFADALERASQGNYADNGDAEITLPRQARSSGVPIAPITSAIPTLQPVFLSAASADAEFAARLKADLQTQKVVFSNDHTDDTLDQEEAMRQAIRAAQFVLVILSPSTRSSRLVARHMHIANMYGRQMLFVWMAGDEVAPLLPIPDVWAKTAVIDVFDARTSSYELALKKVIDCLEREAGSSTLTAPTRSEMQHEPRNPYKGLRAFTKDEATDFFGRDTLIDELVETLRNMLADERSDIASMRLLTVLGPSGSGKSSVVMAGLLPRLQQDVLSSSQQWLYLDPLVPGTRPLESLVLTLVPHLPSKSTDNIREILEEESARGLHLLATHLTGHSGTKVLLVIDQFEELFAQSLPEQERQHFIDLLCTAVTEPDGPVIAVLTLRADCYDRPMRYPQLSHLIETGHVSVLPMALHDLRAVIEEPAAQPDVQLTFEGNLVGDLLFEAQGQAGALPLLEFTLDQLYQHREGHWLTLNAYQEIGGVKGALIRHAESTYASLPSEEHRVLARTLFLRLLDPGVTEQDTTRRRASIRELSLPDEQETLMLGAVADAFIDARLLTTSEVAGEVTIEVSHEALIREWERLTKWLREAREDFTLQKALANDTAEWIQRGKPADRLYRGNRLIEMQAWARRNRSNRDESAFLQAAEAERRAQEVRVIEQKEREVTLQRRVISHQRWLINALLVFSMVVVVLGSVAWIFYGQANNAAQEARTQRNNANLQAEIARSQALAADAIASLSQNQLDQALLLSRAAYQRYPTYEARNSLFISLEKSSQLVTMLHAQQTNVTFNPMLSIAFSPTNSTTLISASFNHIYVWNNANTKTRNSPTIIDPPAVAGASGYIGGMALSPDGQQIAISSAFGVWLQNIQAGSQPISLDGKEGGQPNGAQVPTPITFTADGKLILSARCDNYGHFDQSGVPHCTSTKISTYDVATKQRISSSPIIMANADSAVFRLHSQPLELATISDANTIQFWEVKTGKLLNEISTGNTETISRLAFSADGSILATVGKTSIQLWDVSTGRQRPGSPFAGYTNSITDVTFSHDGSQLAASSMDNTVTVWDVASGKLNTTLTGNGQAKTSVAFSLDGTMLASGAEQGTILLWKPSAKSTLSQQVVSTSNLNNVLFTPDGKFLLVGRGDGKVLVYDAQTMVPINTLSTEKYPLLIPDGWSIESLALGGGKLVGGRMDGTIVLWDTKTWQSLPKSFIYAPHYLSKVMLSADGRVLAATGNGDRVLLWDVVNRKALPSIPYPRDESQIARPLDLSPDGKALAIGQCSIATNKLCVPDQIQFWDVFTGKMTDHTSPKSGNAISGIAFSPDRHTLAFSNSDGIILWDRAQNRQQLALPFHPDQSQETIDYSSILFSPDGKRLVFYSSPTSAFSFILWILTLPSPEPLVQVFKEEDFGQGNIAFSPDGQRLASVSVSISSPSSSILTLWDLSVASWQKRACTMANRNLTVDERDQFVKDSSRISICPDITA